VTTPVQIDTQPDGVAILTVNRPEVRNALNWEAMHSLQAAVEQLEGDLNLRAVIVTGAGGRSFISGGDVRDLHNDVSEEAGLRQHDLMASTLDRLAALPVPVIAAIEGAARGGGCEVALACDMRFASCEATLGFAQITMGVSPGWGGAGRLAALVGPSRAFDLLLTGRVLDAKAAHEIGLIDRITDVGKSLDDARSLASRIATQPMLAVRGVKDVLHGYRTMPGDAARARERSVFAMLWATEDHAEASSAFLAKRDPVFKGK
jgi:enoyl-CoA hydratase/carnithine racemase